MYITYLSYLGAEKYGIWANVCGGRYLFGNKIVKTTKHNYWTLNQIKCYQKTNWTENYATCCRLGMDPLILTSIDEQQCLSNFTSSAYTNSLQRETIYEILIGRKLDWKSELLDRRDAGLQRVVGLVLGVSVFTLYG